MRLRFTKIQKRVFPALCPGNNESAGKRRSGKTRRGNHWLRTVLIECSFPSRYEWLAKASLHLTPRLLAKELEKLRADIPVLVTHIKPEGRDEVLAELAALKDRRLRVLLQGETIEL